MASKFKLRSDEFILHVDYAGDDVKKFVAISERKFKVTVLEVKKNNANGWLTITLKGTYDNLRNWFSNCYDGYDDEFDYFLEQDN